MDLPLDIRGIAETLNERAQTHAIGELQTIRAELKGGRRAGSNIFSAQTIHAEWAFHHGARSGSELQFNIGTETVSKVPELRHGVAFSFKLSRTLLSLDVLEPKVRHFNNYLAHYPETYGDMRMWHFDKNNTRSADFLPSPIKNELVTSGTFVFLGKRQPIDDIDYEVILNDFDRLLPLFVYIESSVNSESADTVVNKGFSFQPGFTAGPTTTTATQEERTLTIDLKHNMLQAALYSQLIAKYGASNVGGERPTVFGNIDIVVRLSDIELWYYEIKTAPEPRKCLREALGQIMEYAYWPGASEAQRLIICGESPLDDDGKAYLHLLKVRFGLPIEYEQIVL